MAFRNTVLSAAALGSDPTVKYGDKTQKRIYGWPSMRCSAVSFDSIIDHPMS
jgi:hypothetical protein